MVLEAYFDDSGTHKNSNVTVWAGFIASKEQWLDFNIDWQAQLAEPEFKLTRFHMYDIVHGDGECTGWEQGRRDLCIKAFRDIILNHNLCGIGISIPTKDWDEIALPSKQLSYPAEQFALSACIPISRHHSQVKDDEIIFIFDNRQRTQPAVDLALDFYKNDGLKPKILSSAFSSSKSCSGLQAADMLAWETYQYSLGYLESGIYPKPSPHFRHLLEKGNLHGEFYTRERIKTLVLNAKPNPYFASRAS